MSGSDRHLWLGGLLLAAALSAQAQEIPEESRRPRAAGKGSPPDLVVPQRGIVGLRVDADERGGLRILTVIPGWAAERAGIREGDRLVAIEGKEMRNASVQDAVALLRGDAGSSVKVTVVREGGTPVEHTLVREAFEMLE